MAKKDKNTENDSTQLNGLQGENNDTPTNTPDDGITTGTAQINGAQGVSEAEKWITSNNADNKPRVHVKEFNNGTFGRCSTLMVYGKYALVASIDQQRFLVTIGLSTLRGTFDSVASFSELDDALANFRKAAGL